MVGELVAAAKSPQLRWATMQRWVYLPFLERQGLGYITVNIRQMLRRPERWWRVSRSVSRRLWLPRFPEIPTKIAGQLGTNIKRVFLVANNRHLPLSNLPNDLTVHDLIVQFNSCIYITHFLSSSCSKLFVFRANKGYGLNHGYPPSPSAVWGINPTCFHGQLCVLFVDDVPAASDAPAVLRGIIRDPSAIGHVNSFRGMFKSYPKPSGVRFAGPSTGFVTLQLFLEARRRLLQHIDRKFEIVLLGFEDTPDDTFWHGHNWAFERSFVAHHSAELTLSIAHE